MATGGFVKELAEDLVCPVCMEEFDRPKVLQCKYVFCTPCLTKVLYRNKLVCPICRDEKVFGGGTGIDSLPEPLIISHMQEKITAFLSSGQNTGPVSRNCGISSKVNSATTFCIKCVQNMCEQCTNQHKKSKITTGHSLVTLSKRTICQKHPSHFIAAYCMDCTQGLCMTCANTEHVTHNVIDMEDKTLVKEKNTQLTSYIDKLRGSGRLFINYKSEVRQSSQKLTNAYDNTKQHLKDFKKSIIKATDEEIDKIDVKKAAEVKKLAMHEEEIENIRATRESMASFIKDIQQRNSAPDIVLSADDLPDITTNSVPVLPKLDLPVINDVTNDLIQSIKGLITYSRDYVKHEMSHSEHSAREVVSPHTTLSSGSIGDRSGGAVSKVKTSSIGSMGETISVRQVWEVEAGVDVWDVTWDTEGPGWWVRNEIKELFKYDMKGTVVTKIKKGMPDNNARICIDTTRNHLVIVDRDKGLLCMTKTGKVVRKIPIPGGRCMWGVTYSHHRDIYVVTDVFSHCLWFVSSDSGKVIHKVGSEGSGDTQFNYPYFVCHQTISDSECHIIVSDRRNHYIKLLSPTGEFIRKYGCEGSGDRQLQSPRGVCADPQGRVVVCDWGNYRVVRYWWDEGEKWDVILTKQQLWDERAQCVSMSPDGRHLVVGMGGGEKTIRGYELEYQ